MTGRSKLLAPLVSVVAVVAVAVAAALLAGGGSSHQPRVLRLADSGTAATRDAAAPAAAGTSGSGEYTLTGTLPSGQPPDAPAWTLPTGAGPEGPVARLASALGEGDPAQSADGWTAGQLRVSGTGARAWYFSPCAADTAVSSDGSVSSIGCAVAVDGGPAVAPQSSGGSSGSSGTAVAPVPPPAPDASPAPPVDPTPVSTPVAVPLPATPTEAVVRAAAAPVLEAVGLDPATARVTTFPGGGSAVVDPVVDGLPTVGWTTQVQVGSDGKVMGANGWLGAPEKGDSYPLVSAQEAFDALPSQPRMLACPVGPDGKGCVEPQPQEITGAHLGLLLSALADGGQALLPAWLFDVKGSDDPVAGVAVEPRFLATGDEPTEPGTEPGTGGVPPPTQVDPAPPAAQRWPVMIQAAAAGKGNELVVTYDNGGCGEKNVSGYTKEDATTVYVGLEADAHADGETCTDDYRPATITLLLQAPLGDRKVVNTNATSVEVPRQSS